MPSFKHYGCRSYGLGFRARATIVEIDQFFRGFGLACICMDRMVLVSHASVWIDSLSRAILSDKRRLAQSTRG